MRMDGVYRVILNVSLFKNMTCSLVQEKFLRFIASETPGKLTTFLLKVWIFGSRFRLLRERTIFAD